ncbi:hypothetical protein TWF281_004851 [Arthrobotrys megalospora]
METVTDVLESFTLTDSPIKEHQAAAGQPPLPSPPNPGTKALGKAHRGIEELIAPHALVLWNHNHTRKGKKRRTPYISNTYQGSLRLSAQTTGKTRDGAHDTAARRTFDKATKFNIEGHFLREEEQGR